jgi:hypothetical protein
MAFWHSAETSKSIQVWPPVFPPLVPQRFIRIFAHSGCEWWPGEIILDPFAGVGTTLIAARSAPCRYIGIGGVAGLVGIESGVVSGLLNPNDSALEAPMETTPWKGLSRSLLSCMQKAAQVPSFLRTGSARQ